jgi:hypothetical protein
MHNETRNINGTDFKITVYDLQQGDRVKGMHAFIDNDSPCRFHGFAEAVELNEWEGCTWTAYEATQEAALVALVESIEDTMHRQQREVVSSEVAQSSGDSYPVLMGGFISTPHEARPGFALVEIMGSTSRAVDRSTDEPRVLANKMKRSLKFADQRADEYRALLQRAYAILADQPYDDDTCRLLSEIEKATGIDMEDSDVTSR